MKRISLSLYIVFSSLFIFGAPTFAATTQTPNCEQVFNGGTTCEQNEPITVNKQIQNPANQSYVDSLPSEAAFKPGQTMRFKITVSNTGNSAVTKIEVSDSFPIYIEYAKGSGKYDAKTRTFSFTIDTLPAKSDKVYFVEAKVAAADKLPNSQQVSCVINQAKVVANRKTSQDNVKVCVTKATTQTATQPTSKGGLPIYPPTQSKTTPQTGPEALALISLVPLGAFGLYLRKKA